MKTQGAADVETRAIRRRRWVKGTVIVLLIALPFLLAFIYRQITALPDEVTLATGPEQGRYRKVSLALKDELERELGVRVKIVETQGSMENLRLLAEGKVDFALYQPGTLEALGEDGFPPVDSVRCVANAYSETLHIIVRKDAGIESAGQLRGKRVALGQKVSGDYAASRMLLRHLGLDEEKNLSASYLNYDEITEQFKNNQLDAAIITTGLNAPILVRLFATGRFELLNVPNANAFVHHNISYHTATIPAGLYHSPNGPFPQKPVQTVALSAQLLTRDDLSAGLVRKTAETFFNEKFLRRNELLELFQQGHTFARRKPEFRMHEGALAFYDPELRPVLNPDFVEATENMRSFLVSIVIAGFLVWRWWSRRKSKQQEHRLDRYIRKILDIERQQLELDDKPAFDGSRDITADMQHLQNLLDESTRVRQDALKEFTAHDLNEDHATDSFLEMCHALSDKINAKLTRLRLDLCFARLATNRTAASQVVAAEDECA